MCNHVRVCIETLNETEWQTLRNVRLTALDESPSAFISQYDTEARYPESKWRSEFTRGKWLIATKNCEVAGIIGMTREPETPLDQCYLEYLWVRPGLRRAGIGSLLVETAIGYARECGVINVSLWVIEGNTAARAMYTSLGFADTGIRQPLNDGSGLHEELMQITLESTRQR